MHKEQKDFCKKVKRKFWLRFINSYVIDVGSQDINGSNKYLFMFCKYTGIDLCDGKNVDQVGRAKDVLPTLRPADIVISTEMLEHDNEYCESLKAMYKALKPGGLMLITAAGEGRPEHGTTATSPENSPGTTDYYKNMTHGMFSSILGPELFKEYYLNHDEVQHDFQFYGIKKTPKPSLIAALKRKMPGSGK